MKRGFKKRAGVNQLESRQIVLRNLLIQIRCLRGDHITLDSNERRMTPFRPPGDQLLPFYVSTKLKRTLSTNVRHIAFKSMAAIPIWRSGDLCGRRGQRRPRAARRLDGPGPPHGCAAGTISSPIGTRAGCSDRATRQGEGKPRDVCCARTR